ncbi:MAG TPA: ABC transporter transmembrane domain-containing protein [Gaiellaceae bacterium]|nr:ABC transporter transmembrane domain-containing protein [Gaiellaceae bacterium]
MSASVAEGRAPAPRWTSARVIYGYFSKDVRKRRGKLIAGGLFGVVYALARTAEPWPLKVVLDQVLFGKAARGFWAAPFTIFGYSRYDYLAAAGLWLAAAGVVRGVTYYYEDFLLSSAAQEIVYAIRTRLYRHLHRLPLAFHQRRSTGDLLVRLSSDIVLLRDVLIDSTVNLGTNILVLGLMLAVMLAVDPVLTGISLGVMPPIFLLTILYGRRIRASSKQQRKREGQLAAAMHEALAAIDVVQLHGASEREHERFQQLSRRSLKQGTRAVRLEARMNRGVELALAGGMVVVLWAGAVRALHGALTPGELVVFVSYLRGAYRPLRRASKTVQRGAKALAAAERIVEVLEIEPELTDSPDARPAPPLTGRIAFDDVSFAYGHGAPVLDKISLEARPGQTVAIVGPTGSGKSTLVSLLPRLYDPTAGRVTICGKDVRAFTLESLRAQISIVRQESVLFGLSIADNIRYGAPQATDAEVQAAAEAAGLGDLLAELPDGHDTLVDERGASLSGGERQRVAIARALIRRTPILILDEPTTGLDAAKQHDVLEALRDLSRTATTLLITHDMRLVRESDAIVVLEHGRIVARGSYDELASSSPQFGRLISPEPKARTARAGRQTTTEPTGSGRRALFYSHNGVGVGHLQRQLDLATAYRRRHADAAILLATGSHAASMFEIPDGIDFVKLPSLAMVDRYRTWRPRDLPLPLEQVVELRSELLEQVVDRFAPDLLVADFMPAGPYGELLPALERLDTRGGRAIAGFRDVVDEPGFVRGLWAETGVYEVLRERYAAICVYGDPRMTDFAAAYALDEELAGKLHYCGYLGRTTGQASDLPLYERPFVLASCGGGVDGSGMLEAFIEAAGNLRPALGGSWLAVTGPLMPYEEHLRLVRLAERGNATVCRIVPDLRAHVALADCVVSMPGYNTVCDILTHRRPAVLVPRPGPSREQELRAERLGEWGVARFVRASELHKGRLAAAIRHALEGPTPPAAPVSLEGSVRALDVFDRVLATTPTV